MIFLALFLLSFTLTYCIKKYATKKSLLAEVNERSSHIRATPHGGGIAIALTWFIGLGYLYMYGIVEANLAHALFFGFFISTIGVYDDLYELKPKIRLVIQIVVAFGGLWLLGGLKSLDLLFVSVENQFLNNIFALFLIVWFINLYNFLDGIDGYAGSEALFLALAGFVLFGGSHFLILVVSVLGFLIWNWDRAKIFMGDGGSTLLGYNIAIFTLYYANKEPSDLWIWTILFGIFWFDATVTLVRRKLNGEVISQAHKKHAYQRLTQAGWSHGKVTLSTMALNSMLFFLIYNIPNIYMVFLLTLTVLSGAYIFVEKKKKFE